MKSTVLSSDINPDLAVVIEDTLASTAQAINKANDGQLSETQCNKKENGEKTSVYEDSYTLEHQPDEAEYMVPSSENVKLWRVRIKHDVNDPKLNFSLRLPMIETQTN